MARTRMTASVTALVTAVTAASAMGVAAAPPGPSLKGLELYGECNGEVKAAWVKPRTPFLFAPLRLLDDSNRPTGKWLFPVTIYAEGEGLKARHMTPGETYTRPGKAPKKEQVTCTFYGKSPDGDVRLEITGPIRPS